MEASPSRTARYGFVNRRSPVQSRPLAELGARDSLDFKRERRNSRLKPTVRRKVRERPTFPPDLRIPSLDRIDFVALGILNVFRGRLARGHDGRKKNGIEWNFDLFLPTLAGLHRRLHDVEE